MPQAGAGLVVQPEAPSWLLHGQLGIGRPQGLFGRLLRGAVAEGCGNLQDWPEQKAGVALGSALKGPACVVALAPPLGTPFLQRWGQDKVRERPGERYLLSLKSR